VVVSVLRISRPCPRPRLAPEFARRAVETTRQRGVDEDPRRPVDRVPEFLLLLQGVGRPTDVLVLTTAEWTAREGTALHREVVSRGVQLHPSS
jgi:hypothetical protein